MELFDLLWTGHGVTAWRVAHILPRIKTIRNHGYGLFDTLCGLVVIMNGRANREKIRLRESADDLGMTVDELTVKLNRLDTLWPCADELCVMLDWLSEPEGQDRLALKVRQAITDGYVEGDERLVNRVEQIEDRMYMQNVQIEHDAASRAQGEVSLG